MLLVIKRIVIIVILLLTVGPYENIDTDAAKERFLGYKQEIADIVSPFDVYMNYNYADSNGSVRASFTIIINDGTYPDDARMTVDFECSNIAVETVDINFLGSNDAWTPETVKMFAALTDRFSYKDMDIEEWEKIITELSDKDMYRFDNYSWFSNESSCTESAGLTGYVDMSYYEHCEKNVKLRKID